MGDESSELNGYILKERIGRGSFGRVYLAYTSPAKEKLTNNKMSGPLALKEVKIGNVSSKKYRSRLNASRREAMIMKQLAGHPHIVTIFEEFTDVSNSSRFFSMELADAGSLYDEVNRHKKKSGIDRGKVRRWFAQIISAVNYMHMMGFVHRDLKLSNILLKSPDEPRRGHRAVKLADFGSADQAYVRSKGGIKFYTNFCGTLSYMAPEVIAVRVNPQRQHPYNPFPVDMWALGVCLFLLITCNYPFAVSVDRIDDSFKHTSTNTYHHTLDPNLPDDLKTLIAGLLDPNTKQRLSMGETFKSHWLRKSLMKIVTERSSKSYDVAKKSLYSCGQENLMPSR